MINKRELFRKLKKNRFLVLAISVIVITGVYYGVQKAIDSYNFKHNDEWAEFDDVECEVEHEEQEVENKGWFEKLFGRDDGGVQENGDEVEEGTVTEESSGEADESGKVPENEVDLELEKLVEDATDVEEKSGQEEEANSVTEEKIYVYITGEVNVPRSCNFK